LQIGEDEVVLLANRGRPKRGVRWRFCVEEENGRKGKWKKRKDILEKHVVVEEGGK